MDTTTLEREIIAAWEVRETLTPETKGVARNAVETALAALDSGALRVAERGEDGWQVNAWLKKAVLLSFRLSDMSVILGGPEDMPRGPPAGSIRSPRSSPVGMRSDSARPVFVPSPPVSCGAPPISRAVSC